MLCVAAFLVAFPTSAALAGKFNAVVNGKSYHFNSTYDWNENNFGLGIEHEFDSKSAWRVVVMANTFRDSTDNMSYMAGAGLHRRLYETERLSGLYVQVGLNAFIMTRDDVVNSKPCPSILPSVSIGNEKIGFNLTYLPKQAIEMTTHANVIDPTVSGILLVKLGIVHAVGAACWSGPWPRN